MKFPREQKGYLEGLDEEVCHCGDLVSVHQGMSHNHSPVTMEREYEEAPSEEFDIMKYGEGVSESCGLMTKKDAEVHAALLPEGYRIIGWRHGTCQSVFSFWVPEPGLAIEIHHAKETPTGRKAAILVQKAKASQRTSDKL